MSTVTLTPLEPITRDALIARLRDIAAEAAQGAWVADIEELHGEADLLLLRYIADDEIRAAFSAIDKWYA